VGAAIIYLYGNPNLIEDDLILGRVKSLSDINNELEQTAEMFNIWGMKPKLERAPHVWELLQTYIKYRSVGPLLDSVRVPYNQDQLRSVRKFVRAKSVEDSQEGFTNIANRYLLAKWLYGTQESRDGKISEAAEFVLSNNYWNCLPPNLLDLVGAMRTFLIGIMDAEYKLMGNGYYADIRDLEMFPERYSGAIEEVAEVYRRFGSCNYCPSLIKQYACLVVEQVPWRERIGRLGFKYFSNNWLFTISTAGSRFLEAVLAAPRTRIKWSAFEMDTGESLKDIKRLMLNQ
jgi:hypothetical protein